MEETNEQPVKRGRGSMPGKSNNPHGRPKKGQDDKFFRGKLLRALKMKKSQPLPEETYGDLVVKSIFDVLSGDDKRVKAKTVSDVIAIIDGRPATIKEETAKADRTVVLDFLDD